MVSHFTLSSAYILSTLCACKKLLNRRCISSVSKLTSTTINAEEVKKFDSAATEWWDGKQYELLRSSNSMRVPLIRDGLLSMTKIYKKISHPLEGFQILDVGCGGGVLSEPLARLGAKVTGLDPGSQNIQAAIEHAEKDLEIRDKLNYVCHTVENLAISGIKFDAVVCSEVIEHVNDVQTFLHSCIELTKTKGSLFFTTINQTTLSYILSILMAEYVLALVPQGTHDWNKFMKVDDLIQILTSLNCSIISVEGIMYNPITKKFSWSKNSANWYALHAVKQ